jgi:hypothetical protein
MLNLWIPTLIRIEVKVAIIVVFTKYDLLFDQHFRELRKAGKMSHSELQAAAEKNTATDLERHIVALQSSIPARVECVKVSTHKNYSRSCHSSATNLRLMTISHLERFDMLRTLTSVTRQCLDDIEGVMRVTWAAAQQINAMQKVLFSIECVSKSVSCHSVTHQSFYHLAKASRVRIPSTSQFLHQGYVLFRVLGRSGDEYCVSRRGFMGLRVSDSPGHSESLEFSRSRQGSFCFTLLSR